jgi:hypothetical protein
MHSVHPHIVLCESVKGTFDVVVDGPFLASLLRWRRIPSKEHPEPVERSTREGPQKEALKVAIGDLFV